MSSSHSDPHLCDVAVLLGQFQAKIRKSTWGEVKEWWIGSLLSGGGGGTCSGRIQGIRTHCRQQRSQYIVSWQGIMTDHHWTTGVTVHRVMTRHHDRPPLNNRGHSTSCHDKASRQTTTEQRGSQYIVSWQGIMTDHHWNARVVGAPQMISQPVSSIFPSSPAPTGTCRTPGLSIPWCCLPTSSSVCLVFFPLLLCLASWFWPDLMNGWHDQTWHIPPFRGITRGKTWKENCLENRLLQLGASLWKTVSLMPRSHEMSLLHFFFFFTTNCLFFFFPVHRWHLFFLPRLGVKKRFLRNMLNTHLERFMFPVTVSVKDKWNTSPHKHKQASGRHCCGAIKKASLWLTKQSTKFRRSASPARTSAEPPSHHVVTLTSRWSDSNRLVHSNCFLGDFLSFLDYWLSIYFTTWRLSVYVVGKLRNWYVQVYLPRSSSLQWFIDASIFLLFPWNIMKRC